MNIDKINTFLDEVKALQISRNEILEKILLFSENQYDHMFVYYKLGFNDEFRSLLDILKLEEEYLYNIKINRLSNKELEDLVFQEFNYIYLLNKCYSDYTEFENLIKYIYSDINESNNLSDKISMLKEYYQLEDIILNVENNVFYSEVIDFRIIEEMNILSVLKSERLSSLIDSNLDIEFKIYINNSLIWDLFNEDESLDNESFNENLLVGLKNICFNTVPKATHAMAVGAIVLGSLLSTNALGNDIVDHTSVGQSMIERTFEMGADEAIEKYKGCLHFAKNQADENFCVEHKDFLERLKNYKEKLDTEIEKVGNSQYCKVSIEGTEEINGSTLKMKYEVNVGNVSYDIDFSNDNLNIEVTNTKIDPRCDLDNKSISLIKSQLETGFTEYQKTITEKVVEIKRGIASSN